MTTQTEALKMVLEALVAFNGQHLHIGGWIDFDNEIAAIKEALIQDALQALHDENKSLGPYEKGYADAMNWKVQNHLEHLPTAQPKLQTCNCRWDGEVQVQQCTLHESHVDAVHEWAERAKTAEAKLKAQPKHLHPSEDVSIGVDVTSEGTHVTAMRSYRNGVKNVIYSQFHPLAQPKEPEQEPVAWLWVVDGKHHNVTFGGANSNTPKGWTVCPLYTHPPVPTAQPKPLTDKKISLLAHNVDPDDWNSIHFRDCWHKGFKAGFREAEVEHNIKG